MHFKIRTLDVNYLQLNFLCAGNRYSKKLILVASVLFYSSSFTPSLLKNKNTNEHTYKPILCYFICKLLNVLEENQKD